MDRSAEHGGPEPDEATPEDGHHGGRRDPGPAPAPAFVPVAVLHDPLDKAAVLVCRLAWNHPLPDGNKRAAWVSLAMFLALNGWVFAPDPPDVDEAEALISPSRPTRSMRAGYEPGSTTMS